MYYASFRAPDGAPTWGVVVGDTAHDLGPSGLGLAPDLRAAIERGVFGEIGDRFRDAPARPRADVEFLPPVPDPGKIVCVGVNYRSHQRETGRAAHQAEQAAPTLFIRFADSQIGHEAPALMPTANAEFDYEGELALVIGREAWRVPESDAFDHVAGYGAYNDFSVRDWQLAATQWTPGKNFPGTGGFGPYLVPAADVGDVDQLVLETRVNGETRQKASVGDLYFTIPQLIAYITSFTRLAPGDVVVTGTPGGVGRFMDPPGLLGPGDVVEVEISRLGTLRNAVRLAE